MLVVSALLLLLRAILPGLREQPHTIAGAVVRPRTLYCWLADCCGDGSSSSSSSFLPLYNRAHASFSNMAAAAKVPLAPFLKSGLTLLLHGLRNSNDSSSLYYYSSRSRWYYFYSLDDYSFLVPTHSRRELGLGRPRLHILNGITHVNVTYIVVDFFKTRTGRLDVFLIYKNRTQIQSRKKNTAIMYIFILIIHLWLWFLHPVIANVNHILEADDLFFA